MLYINQGDHQYKEVAQDAGVDDGAWGWGTVAVDLDNKGWVDLVEVNGRHIAPFHNVPPRLFYNNADGTFSDIADSAGLTHPEQGRGVVRIDVDRDGRQDLIVINYAQPLRYYRNETQSVGNWLGVALDTSTNPLLAPNGFGARVIAHVGNQSFTRYMHGHPSYLATSELLLHFGLGNADVIDTLEVMWPRGYTTILKDVPANQYLTIASPKPGDFNGDGQITGADLLMLLSTWGSVTSAHNLYADLNDDRIVDTTDLQLLLSWWD